MNHEFDALTGVLDCAFYGGSGSGGRNDGCRIPN
jgi:hypothetical protein